MMRTIFLSSLTTKLEFKKKKKARPNVCVSHPTLILMQWFPEFFFFGKEAALELAVYCFLPHTLLKETNETELSMYQKNGSYQKDVAQGKSTIILCTS